MKDFRNLLVWEKAHKLTLKIYTLSKGFPKEEMYGLTSQLRRAVSSIPINIAEGCGRGSNAVFARFLQISMGSASETEYLILLCQQLGYISDPVEINKDIKELKMMLASLINKTRTEVNIH
jgi:four helix bundle protein